jgi:hypothetical protein
MTTRARWSARQRQAGAAGVQVAEDGLDGLLRALPARVEPQADPLRLFPQHRLEPRDRPPARTVRGGVVPRAFPSRQFRRTRLAPGALAAFSGAPGKAELVSFGIAEHQVVFVF